MENKISRRQAFYIAISILVAVSIWIFVDINNAQAVKVVARDVPVEYVGEDGILAERGLMLLDDGTETAVDLELTGTRWDVAMLDRSKIRVQVDLADVTETGRQNVSYRIIYPSRAFNNAIKATDASTFTVDINVGELYSKSVDVRCEIRGKIADGYNAGELKLNPNRLDIRGQHERIDPISYAKVILNLDDAESSVMESLEYEYFDSNDQPVSKEGIHAQVDRIDVRLPVNVTKELQLTMDFVESNGARLQNIDWAIEPSTITVSGDAAMLNDVDTIVLDKFDLLTLGKTETPHHFAYAIKVPEGCENLSGVTRAMLNISFRDMKAETVTADTFECIHVPEDKQVDIITEELDVEVFGPKAQVDAAAQEKIVIRVDLKNLSDAAGSYTVPAEVLIPGNRNLGIAGDYQVRLTISEVGENQEPDREEPPADAEHGAD